MYPDADVDKAIAGAVAGMNFTWCGQSCGSTSRVFVHASIHDRVVAGIVAAVQRYKPGIPTDRGDDDGRARIAGAARQGRADTSQSGCAEGAALSCGGARPRDPQLANGYFMPPTVFTDVTQSMRIASEEIFGPVLCVLPWTDEDAHARRRQRRRLRLERVDLHARPRDRAPLRVARRGRLRLDQHDGPPFPRRAVRRLQAIGAGARGVLRRTARATRSRRTCTSRYDQYGRHAEFRRCACTRRTRSRARREARRRQPHPLSRGCGRRLRSRQRPPRSVARAFPAGAQHGARAGDSRPTS